MTQENPIGNTNPTTAMAMEEELLTIPSQRFNPDYDIKRNSDKYKFGDPVVGNMAGTGRAGAGDMEMYGVDFDTKMKGNVAGRKASPFSLLDDGTMPKEISPSIGTGSRWGKKLSDRRMHQWWLGKDTEIEDPTYRQIRYRGDSGIYERDPKFLSNDVVPPQKVVVMKSPEDDVHIIKNKNGQLQNSDKENVNHKVAEAPPLVIFAVAGILGFLISYLWAKKKKRSE